MEEISRLAEKILQAKFLVAFAGAGLSQESGIPTFRGDEGIWKKYPPIIFGNLFGLAFAFVFMPRKFREFVFSSLSTFTRAQPNPAHLALGELFQAGILKAVITQNIDDLERRAGVGKLVQLHGNIYRLRCLRCKERFEISLSELEEFLSQIRAIKSQRELIKRAREFARCPRCSSWSRPDIVFFGEGLNSKDYYSAIHLAQSSDLFLILGTSGVVQPAGSIPLYARRAGALLVEINPEPTALSGLCDFTIRSSCAFALSRTLEEIKKLAPERFAHSPAQSG